MFFLEIHYFLNVQLSESQSTYPLRKAMYFEGKWENVKLQLKGK